MKSLIVSLFVFASVSCYSQITASVITPDEAVAILCGPNVVYSNVTFTGGVEQLGSYQNAAGSFQIPEGIILSCDGAMDIVPGVGTTPITNPVSGEPDLLDVANSVPPLINQSFTVSAVNDVAILEFDFVATGPNLSFNYVFGSDEYLTYVNTQFNDVFAFFIAGPGITGSYWAPAGFPDGSANIAIVPNSVPQLPITISSVNNILNSDYYIDNPGGADGNMLNGYTTMIAATSDLQCGETYHMRLAIADGSDDFLKSIVALQAGSFNVSGTFLEAGPVNPPANFSGSSVLEGCINGYLELHAPACSQSATVSVITGGIAIPGLDYSSIPSTVTFDDPVVTIPLDIYEDDLVEGTESITIQMIYTNLDGELDTANIALDVLDYQQPTVVVDDVYICEESASGTAVVANGFGPFMYSWSSGGTGVVENYVEGDAGDYTVTVTDYCGTVFDTTFTVIEPTPFAVDPFIDICFGLTSNTIATGGAPPYDVIYSTDSLELTGDYQLQGVYNGVYDVFVQDQCGSSGFSEVTVQVCQTRAPNIFTPDGDGINDNFHIFGLEGFPNSQVMIFDRWGNKILDDADYKNNWNGGDLSDGVYYYILKRSDGKSYEGSVHKIGSK